LGQIPTSWRVPSPSLHRPSAPVLRRISGVIASGVALTALALCAVVVVALLAGEESAEEPVQRGLLKAVVVALPVAAGLYAARSPRNARFGYMLIGAGVVWALTALAETSESLPYSVGRVAAWLIFPLLAYLMLAFPTGRLTGRVDRVLFGGIASLVALLYIGSAFFVEQYPAQTPWTACEAACPPNAFLLVSSEPAVMEDLVRPVRELLAVLLLGGVSAALVHRMRLASALGRRTHGPVLTMCIAYSVTLIAFVVARRVAPGAPAVDVIGVLWALCVPGIAVAFFLGLLRRRLLAAEVLERVSLAVAGRVDRVELRDALATALEDPSLDVLCRERATGRWRDTGGQVTAPPADVAGRRAVTLLHDDGVPRAALLHDRSLSDDDELLESVGSMVLATLEHERLEQELATSLSRLERSRKRIARAADLERSRIERDLHDGAQQRLITMRIRLSLAEEQMRSDPARGMKAVHDVGDEIDLALDELRSIAHGVYPSLLSDRGLADAVRSVAAASPLPVCIEVSAVGRYPPEIETAVYFTCVEAIQNAIKHAQGATEIRVVLRTAKHSLRFEVGDDGAGFDPPVGEFNGGLRNMRDRMEAIDGRITVDSAPGRGTHVRGLVLLT